LNSEINVETKAADEPPSDMSLYESQEDEALALIKATMTVVDVKAHEKARKSYGLRVSQEPGKSNIPKMSMGLEDDIVELERGISLHAKAAAENKEDPEETTKVAGMELENFVLDSDEERENEAKARQKSKVEEKKKDSGGEELEDEDGLKEHFRRSDGTAPVQEKKSPVVEYVCYSYCIDWLIDFCNKIS